MTLAATRSIAFGLAAFAAMGCETTIQCNAAFWYPGANIEIERFEWTQARYDIELAYAQRGKQRSYRCAAIIGTANQANAEHPLPGEILFDEDSGVDRAPTRSAFCEPADSDQAKVELTIDTSLRLFISNDTPKRVHLVVREAGELLLETDVALEYESEELNGPGCGGTPRAEATVRLP